MELRLVGLFIISSLFLTGQSSKARIRIDSSIKANKKLVYYKDLNYCQKINFIDSLTCNDNNSFTSWYFKLAVLDITTKAGIDPKMDMDSKAYFRKEDYFAISDRCRKKLKCKEGKMSKKERKKCINK